MGHRPLDLASASGHVGVAQLLRLHDAALCLSAETLDANEELESLRTDYAELKSHFRFNCSLILHMHLKTKLYFQF